MLEGQVLLHLKIFPICFLPAVPQHKLCVSREGQGINSPGQVQGLHVPWAELASSLQEDGTARQRHMGLLTTPLGQLNLTLTLRK